MNFDKEKLRRMAEKNLAQGKITAAIKDYKQLVEFDPRDYNTLNMLGDLYVRISAKSEAINCFERIADHYESRGFTHKAIAMYKKIGRLKPDDVSISARLAPLYQTLGLVAEARAHFLQVADFYQQKGDRLPALEIWQQIADLDPNDVRTRLNLAESYLKEKQFEKAVETYTEAGARLLVKKFYEDALGAFTNALSINPNYIEALSGATEAHIALGFPDEAIEKLEKASGEVLEDSEYYSLLGRCYLELENAEAAEKAYFTLVERERSGYQKLLEVTKIYVKNGDLNAAVRTLEMCADYLLTGGHETEFESWVNEVLTRNPEQIKALHLLAKLQSWQRNELGLKDALERVVEVARFNESVDDEKGALSELRMLFPKETKYAERLKELGVDVSKSVESDSHFASQDHAVPSFESFAGFEDDAAANGFETLPTMEQIDESSWSFAENSPVNSAENFAENSVESFAENFADEAEQKSESEVAIAAEETEEFQVNDYSFVNDVEESFEPVVCEPAAAPKLDSNKLLFQELESVDFYISQGYNDLALETLLQIEAQFGAHSEIETRREQLKPAPQPTPTIEFNSTVKPFADESDFSNNGFDFVVETKPAAANGNLLTINPGFEDLFKELGEDVDISGLETSNTSDFETNYNLGLAYKEMGLFDDAVEEFQAAVKMVTPAEDSTRYLQCCNLIGHCFVEKGMPAIAAKWYQKGLETPGITDEEYQALRFELGAAYEKAGEKEKAIAQYTEVYALNVAYRGVGDKLRSLQTA